MQIELSPELSSLVELGIREGRFRDPKEAIELALAPWVKREQARLGLPEEIADGDEIVDGIPEVSVNGTFDWGPPQGVEFR